MAGTNAQWTQPNRNGHTYSDITSQGDAKGQFGDQIQYTYNYKPIYLQITYNKYCEKGAHYPKAVEVSATIRRSNDDDDDSNSPSRQCGPLTVQAPLNKQDESVLLERLKDAVRRNVVDTIKASTAGNVQSRGQQTSEKLPRRLLEVLREQDRRAHNAVMETLRWRNNADVSESESDDDD